MSDFQRQTFEVGNGSYSALSNDAVLVGLLLTNKSAAQVTATVKIGPSGSTEELVKDVVIPVGSSLSALDGKIVLNASDIVEATSSAASSVNIHISLLELP